MDLDTHIDPAKLSDFHDVLLSRVQDDERAQKAWEESNSADRLRRREERRRAWVEFHEKQIRRIENTAAVLAERHRAKARALLEGTS